MWLKFIYHLPHTNTTIRAAIRPDAAKTRIAICMSTGWKSI